MVFVWCEGDAVDECDADGCSDECHLVFFPLSAGDGCAFVVAYDGCCGGVVEFVEVDVLCVVGVCGLGGLPEGSCFVHSVLGGVRALGAVYGVRT